ncbi:MAG: hypothetical protein JSV20_10335 [Candidatus Bathyarchaeota archaeon]|nr:MAG: hypothetical protein JSV20_10335 [Candidatus Bathyarchaeota archaeon]
MDKKYIKIVVGLAIQNEIRNRSFNQKLYNLYTNPDLSAIGALHDQLVLSDNHFDRETAFWLELALDLTPPKINILNTIVELQEMEVLLLDLMWKVNPNYQRDFNNWLNYIINTVHSIQDGFIIDAKIMASLAFEYSRKQAIIEAMNVENKNPQLRYIIDLLQRETLRCFEQIKLIPHKLKISEKHKDVVLKIQEILIELMQQKLRERYKKYASLISYLIQKLDVSQRHLIRSDLKVEKVKKEFDLITRYLERTIHEISNSNILNWIRNINKRINDLQILLK